jgi:hypothetical protein
MRQTFYLIAMAITLAAAVVLLVPAVLGQTPDENQVEYWCGDE